MRFREAEPCSEFWGRRPYGMVLSWQTQLASGPDRPICRTSHRLYSLSTTIFPCAESLDALIRFEGWGIETFASAEEFLARPRALAPCCLILDVNLSNLNGLDLQEQVTCGRAAVPIIFITGHGDIPMTVRAMKAGGVNSLIKPFGDHALLNAVRQALKRGPKRGEPGSWKWRNSASVTNCSVDASKKLWSSPCPDCPTSKSHIASEFSEITVKAHRGKVMRKMDAASFAELINIAARLGIGLQHAALHAPASSCGASRGRCSPQFDNQSGIALVGFCAGSGDTIVQ